MGRTGAPWEERLPCTGKVCPDELPGDGPVSWTARADLAEAAVAVLLEPDLLEDGPSPALTGSEMLDFNNIAQLASQVLQQPIVRDVVTDEAYMANLVQGGMPEVYVGLLLSLFTAARAGEFSVIDPTLARVLGRAPTTMRQVLTAYLEKPEKSIFQGR